MATLTNKYVFSGHESFPCKTLWLKKGYDFVLQEDKFSDPDAVIKLGVGKNMVASIRYWLRVFGIYDGDQPTWLGNYLFSENNGNEDFSSLPIGLDLIRQDLEGKGYYFNVDGKRKVTKEILLYALLKLKEFVRTQTFVLPEKDKQQALALETRS